MVMDVCAQKPDHEDLNVTKYNHKMKGPENDEKE